jgi:hypothetical protein
VRARCGSLPATDIFAIQQTENEGGFDETRPVLGDRVRLKAGGALSGMDLVVANLDEKTAQLFSPLFGGARVTAKTSSLTRAA